VAGFKAESQHLVLAAELVTLPVADTTDTTLKVNLFRILSSPTSALNTGIHACCFIHSTVRNVKLQMDLLMTVYMSETTTASIGTPLGSLEGIRLPVLLGEKDSKSVFLY
jgi:hypothetical protein